MTKPAESSIVHKCAQVLDILTQAHEPITFSQIQLETGFVKSSCHRILAVLQSEQLVDYNKSAKTYRTGTRLRTWSQAAWRRTDLQDAASEIMTELSHKTGMNSALSVLDSDCILYVRTINLVPARFAAHSGDHAPLHCTAAGKIFVAHMNPEVRDDLLSSISFEKHTEHTITQAADLIAQIPDILQQGTAVAEREEILQVTGIAAPVRDAQGEIVAALSLWSLAKTASPEEVSAQGPFVIEAAEAISSQLGWSPQT
jgi:DNA-binding IclR family transcriptional regulator